MIDYFKMAAMYKYTVLLLVPNTQWRSNPDVLVEKSSKKMTRSQIQGLRFGFDEKLTAKEVIASSKVLKRSPPKTTTVELLMEELNKGGEEQKKIKKKCFKRQCSKPVQMSNCQQKEFISSEDFPSLSSSSSKSKSELQ